MRLRFLLPLVLALLLSAPALATTVLKLPLEQMARDVDLVLRGTVVNVAGGRMARDPAALETRVTVRIATVLKGHATAPTLTIHLPGGTDGQRTFRIPGMPGFKVGEEIVLFLQRTANGWVPAGLSEGKFTVERDAAGRLKARRALSDAHRLVRDKSGRLVEHEGLADDDLMDLDDLLGRIRRATGQGVAR